MIFSVIIYFFYIVLILLIPIFFHRKRYDLVLMALIFSVQLNVTCIIKAGITFSFFEISLLETFTIIYLESRFCHKTISWRINKIDYIFVVFLFFSFISMCVAFLRLLYGDLPFSSEYPVPPMIRSLMSLNKPLFYLLLIPVGNYILNKIDTSHCQSLFIKYLAFSGVLPAVAVVLQWMAIGFVVIHNNPSYSENALRITEYIGIRPVGLSNEAAGHCFELFFAYIGLIHSGLKSLIGRKTFIWLLLLFVISVVLSISRTGLVFFIGYSIYAYWRYSRQRTLSKIILSLGAGIVVVAALSQLKIGGFNLFERLMSTMEVEADLSTIERYGLAEALIGLAVDKGLFFGIGIYNYFYYLKDYIPDYVTISYPYGMPLPSFNFIVQLIAEWGLPCFIVFLILSVRQIRSCQDRIVNEWFISLSLFAMSFQILNFSLPFIIMLYPLKKNLYDSKNHSFLLA